MKKLARHARTLLVLIIAVAALAAMPLTAFAQDLPAVAANNPNAPTLVGWSVIATLLIGAVLKALSPDNTSLPFRPSVAVLHAINVVGAIATTMLTGIVGGTPWAQAVAAGALPLVVGFTHVGAAAGALKTKDAIARNTAVNSVVPPAT